MAAKPILIAPHPILNKKAEAVEHIDDDILTLLDDMKDTLDEATGIGLAAPQIGVSKRVVIIEIENEDTNTGLLELINPEILETSQEQSPYEEGCLSFPGQYTEIIRPSRVKIRYLDRTGATQILEADGLLATCIQHEIDHLDGITFVKHVSRLKRDMIMRRLKRSLKK